MGRRRVVDEEEEGRKESYGEVAVEPARGEALELSLCHLGNVCGHGVEVCGVVVVELGDVNWL